MSEVLGRIADKLATTIAVSLGRAYVFPPWLRPYIWRACGVDVGSRVDISYGVTFRKRDRLVVGDGSQIGSECYFENHAPVIIGRNVGIAARTNFATGTHDLGPSVQRTGAFRAQEIRVGDGAWIGMACTILAGVTIGPGAVVSAGSVVAKDVPADAMVAGNPARVVMRDIDEQSANRRTTATTG